MISMNPKLTWLSPVSLLFVLLPVWWFLGVEQFLWPFLLVPLLCLWIYNHYKKGHSRIYFPVTAKLSALFLLVQLISAFSIAEPLWHLVFLRNFSLWLSGICLFVLIINVVSFESKGFGTLVNVLVVATFFSCLASTLSVFHVLDPKFVSPIVNLLPEDISESEYAAAFVDRSWSELFEMNFFGVFIRRPRSFFTYPNAFAGFLVLTLPLVFYSSRKRGLNRLPYWGLLVLVTFALLSTTSRAGILSCVIGAVFFLSSLSRSLRNKYSRVAVRIVLALSLLTAVFMVTVGDHSADWVETLLKARGRSHLTRWAVYRASIESVHEKPIFGWGTQRPPEAGGLSPSFPPLGSHSTYLAMLFRHGYVGLMLYCAVLFSVLQRARSRRVSPENRKFLQYAYWGIIANATHATLLEVDIDATLLMTMWVVWALVVVATKREPGKGGSGRNEARSSGPVDQMEL